MEDRTSVAVSKETLEKMNNSKPFDSMSNNEFIVYLLNELGDGE